MTLKTPCWICGKVCKTDRFTAIDEGWNFFDMYKPKRLSLTCCPKHQKGWAEEGARQIQAAIHKDPLKAISQKTP